MRKLMYSGIGTISAYVFYLIFDKNQIIKADKIVTLIEVIAFFATFCVHVYGLFVLVAAEDAKKSFKSLISLAKKYIIFGLFLHFFFVILTVVWFVTVVRTSVFNFSLDLLYCFVELFLCCYSWIGIQFILNATVRKSVIPGSVDPTCMIFGEYLLRLGVSQDVIDQAASLQQQDVEDGKK